MTTAPSAPRRPDAKPRGGPWQAEAHGRGRAPRRDIIFFLARLPTLAHHFDGLLRDGAVRDQAEIARLMNVTRAWVTRIMNLLLLALDIQEEFLFFLGAESERKQPVSMRRIRDVVAEPE